MTNAVIMRISVSNANLSLRVQFFLVYKIRICDGNMRFDGSFSIFLPILLDFIDYTPLLPDRRVSSEREQTNLSSAADFHKR